MKNHILLAPDCKYETDCTRWSSTCLLKWDPVVLMYTKICIDTFVCGGVTKHAVMVQNSGLSKRSDGGIGAALAVQAGSPRLLPHPSSFDGVRSEA